MNTEQKSAIEIAKKFPYLPHGDRLVIIPDPTERKLPSGLIIPDTVEERPQSGRVIALGEEVSQLQATLLHVIELRKIIDPTYDELDEPDHRIKAQIGDTVLFGKYAGTEIEVEKVKYLIIRFADVWATVKDEADAEVERTA